MPGTIRSSSTAPRQDAARGPAQAQMWGQSRRRCGPVVAQMWEAPLRISKRRRYPASFDGLSPCDGWGARLRVDIADDAAADERWHLIASGRLRPYPCGWEEH